jgi:hypothetical protein
MARKKNANSAEAAIEAALAAAADLPQWPAHLRQQKGTQPFWEIIIRSRARAEWSENDLIIAAQLARTQLEIENAARELETEGSVIENARGTPVMNPRQSVIEQLARRQFALMRALQMTGAAGSGSRKEDLQKSRKLERQARETREELADDELLA